MAMYHPIKIITQDHLNTLDDGQLLELRIKYMKLTAKWWQPLRSWKIRKTMLLIQNEIVERLYTQDAQQEIIDRATTDAVDMVYVYKKSALRMTKSYLNEATRLDCDNLYWKTLHQEVEKLLTN